MVPTTFDTYVRRAADLMDRRTLLGGLSAALLANGGMPADLEAKNKRKRRNKKGCKKEKKRRNFFFSECDRFPEIPNCKRQVKKCCEKICKSVEKANDCLDAIGT